MRRAQRRRLAIAILIAVVAVATAAAQPAPGDGDGGKVTIALLPLDAEARLALYGQPVAAEISRALAAEGLDVVVVGQGDPVPTRAVLVVDGTIEKKGKGITLRLRVRDPVRAAVMAEVGASAPSLTRIDKAATEVAAKLIPEVRAKLAEIAERARIRPPVGSGSGSGSGSARIPIEPPAPVVPAILLVASSRVSLDGRADTMVAAIAPAFERLIGDVHHRPVAATTVIADGNRALADAIHTAGAALAISIELLSLELGRDKVPTARARARIRIVDAGGTPRFDRIVRTDTLVGKKGEQTATLARYAGSQLAEVIRMRVASAVAP